MHSTSPTPRSAIWLPIFAGLSASLARFAYTQLIPSLIQAHWFRQRRGLPRRRQPNSALFNASGGNHGLLFVIAAGAIVVALLLEQAMRLLNRRHQLIAVSCP